MVDRRRFSLSLLAGIPTLGGWRPTIGPSTAGRATWPQLDPGMVSLTDVEGLRVGHHTRNDRPTGCTVVLAPEGATGGVAVRGSAPGTRETDALAPHNSVDVVHAVLLTGGSAFGLAAADGVVRYLQEQGHGLQFGGRVIPIVPGAVLFDLSVGDGTATPGPDDGYDAAAAATDDPVEQGSVGAGAGATVGKMLGGRRMKGGVGSAGFRFSDGTVVAAIAAVNCRGDVRDPETGEIVAGALDDAGVFLDLRHRFLREDPAAVAESRDRNGLARAESDPGDTLRTEDPLNTTLALVATNRTLTKTQASRLAHVAHDGLARAVVPAHTRGDGDTIFALATGALPEPDDGVALDSLDVAAAAAVAAAIVNGVRAATGLPGISAARDLTG